MKKQYKILRTAGIMVLMLSLLITPSLGEEELNEIVLENFMETIKSSSFELRKAATDVEIAEYKYEIEYDDKGTGGSTILASKLNTEEYDYDTAVKDLAYAEWSLLQETESVTTAATKVYFDYLLVEKEIEAQTAKISRLNDELEITKKRIDLGLSVQSALTTQEMDITKAELELQKLEYSKQSLAYDLNGYLAWDLDKTIDVFDMEVPEFEVGEYELDKIIDDVIENNGEVIKAEAESSLAYLYLSILNDLNYDDDGDDITDAKVAVSDASEAVESAERNVELNVYSGYNDLLNKRDAARLKEIELELLENELEILEKRYEVGLETVSSLNVVRENITFAEIALEQAELDYYIEYLTFENLLYYEED